MSGFARPSDVRSPESSSTRALQSPSVAIEARRTTPQRSAGGPGPASAFPTAARRSPQPRALVRLEKRAVPRNPAPAASHR